MTGHDSNDRTAVTRELAIRVPEQDSWDRLVVENSRDRTAGTGQPRQDSRDNTARTGRREDVTARTKQQGLVD
jgi:hypothetical protein